MSPTFPAARPGGVLAQIVASRGLPPEPVATDALAHLLITSPEAAEAMTTLAAEMTGAERYGQLVFSAQATAGDAAGRPDLIGADASGVRLVGEAKFDASLTEHQTGTAYLDRLPKGQSGLLLFIVPADRLAVIWPRLLSGPGGSSIVPAPNEEPTVHGTITKDLGDGRVLGAVSWPRLLGALRQGVGLAADDTTRSDLDQLEGLVQWRTRTGWLPLLPGDLPDLAGRHLASIRDALMRAASQVSTVIVRNGSGDAGPGRWLKTPGGRWMWAGLWLGQWSRSGISPAWASVSADSDASFAAITQALGPLAQPGGPGRFRSASRTWAVPLIVAAGAEIDPATAGLADQLVTLAGLIDQAAGPAATPGPDDVTGADGNTGEGEN